MTTRDLSPFDFISPLDARYYGPDERFFAAVHPYLSEAATILYQLRVEQALLAELEASGIAPAGTSKALAAALADDPVTPAEVYAEEEKIHHNIRALANCIRRRLDADAQGCVHLFVTSNDVMDTARALALRDVTREVLLPDLHELMGVLVDAARQHADTVQIGRTHGRHAVPLTLGYWLANYVDRLGQRMERIAEAAAELRGMISGAVGAHNSFALRWPDEPAAFERRLLARLGLRPSAGAASTQVVQPEFVADYAHALVSTFSVLANLADDYRHLMRSEIEEVGEKTTRVGSSTMPHKINPKNFENVKSLWKAAMPRMTTVYMDQLSEHQRDLTNSASSRFLNELVAIFAYAVRRTSQAVRGTIVSLPALARNFEAGRQWTVAEPLYIALALSGEKDAYEISKRLAELCRDREMGLLDYLHTAEGGEIVDRLAPELQRVVLDPRQYVGDSGARTRLVCDLWWGGERGAAASQGAPAAAASPAAPENLAAQENIAGRINPLERLTEKLARPADGRALVAAGALG
ncbi:MAG: adenylosuccinate lyase [Acidobacteria bacterium]|nr:adenylosuccinate lyase [Acidobacteriota bacterium]